MAWVVVCLCVLVYACVCVSVSMCVPACVCVCVHVHVCRSEGNLGYHFSRTLLTKASLQPGSFLYLFIGGGYMWRGVHVEI